MYRHLFAKKHCGAPSKLFVLNRVFIMSNKTLGYDLKYWFIYKRAELKDTVKNKDIGKAEGNVELAFDQERRRRLLLLGQLRS